MNKKQKELQDAKKLLRKYWQDKNYAGLWQITLDVVKNIWHHYAGIDSKHRSKQWIFWCILSASLIVGALTGRLQGSAWLPAALVTAYAVYIYKGGRYVLKPKGLGYLLYLAPIAIIMSMTNSSSTEQLRSPAVNIKDSSSYTSSGQSSTNSNQSSDGSQDCKNVTSLGDNSYYDPYSGETIDYPTCKAPEVYGNSAAGTVFLGSSRLLDEGISLEQLKSYEYGAYQYFKGQSPKVTELSIDKSTIRYTLHDPNSTEPRDNISFTLVANRITKYKASLDCFNSSSIQLKLYNIENNSQVFDSGVITNKYLN